jgi:hypothetical protein
MTIDIKKLKMHSIIYQLMIERNSEMDMELEVVKKLPIHFIVEDI